MDGKNNSFDIGTMIIYLLHLLTLAMIVTKSQSEK